MVCRTELLIETIFELQEKYSSLQSLNPSDEVILLFKKLVDACLPPNPIDVTTQCIKVQEMGSKLIKLCRQAEGHLESHYSAILRSYKNPLAHLDKFPYYSNYEKLSELQITRLIPHITNPKGPKHIAYFQLYRLPDQQFYKPH